MAKRRITRRRRFQRRLARHHDAEFRLSTGLSFQIDAAAEAVSEAEWLGRSHRFPLRLITLTVHPRLMQSDFWRQSPHAWLKPASAWALSGYYQDHLIVPDQKATEVLNLLQAMGASTHD